MRIAAVALLCSVAAVPAVAQVRSAAAVKWGPGPAFLPAGARFAVLQGDPGNSGVYTIRLRLPARYVVKPHSHPTDEDVTVLSGTLLVGMGDSMNVRKAQRLTAGGFITAPKDAHHFALTRGPTIIQIHGEGPFEITYVKAADDPRNAQRK
ncbi:MAG TPA: cupin domain-containing protein [Gemmatimonadales bacterium]|nr:cupin domain-containing protein [Gemmatimonadales bacterium]